MSLAHSHASVLGLLQVVVAGVVKSMNVEVAAGRGTARAKSLFLLYVDAVSVTNTKSSGAAASSSSSGGGEEEDAEVSVCA